MKGKRCCASIKERNMRVECGEVLKPLFKLLQIFYVPYYGRCRNLPFGGCTKRPYHGPKRLSPREKMSGVATNVYSKKTLEKPKKDEGLHILKMRVQESFMHGKGISTPRVCHKGRQSLIECANHDFKVMYFPFYAFFMYFLGNGTTLHLRVEIRCMHHTEHD